MHESNEIEVNSKATGHNRDQQADEALLSIPFKCAFTWVGVEPQGYSENEF